MDGPELMVRNSIYSFSPRDSSISASHIREYARINACAERSWTYSFLKRRFRAKSLEHQYKRYEQRILLNNYVVYLILQIILSVLIIVFNIEECAVDSCSYEPVVKSEIYGHLFIVLLSTSIFIFLNLQERRRKRKHEISKSKDETLDDIRDSLLKDYPQLLYALALVSALTIQVVDLASLAVLTTSDIENFKNGTGYGAPRSLLSHVSMEFKTGNHTTVPPWTKDLISQKVPVLTLYNVIFVYLFYPIARKEVTLLFGSVISIVTLTAIHVCSKVVNDELGHEDRNGARQIVADVLYHVCLNFIGWYSRYVGDINNRRGFLDKRGCIETTSRLRHEKDKEEKLLRSIIPDHISSQLRDAIRKFLISLPNKTKAQPFIHDTIEKHNNVSILFADICNFTPLTTSLSAQVLVETLNDLFGKFDDAASERKCMRIKILGDCYYCVSGVPVPDPRHAHNCVEMGLDMIHLIKEVRHEHSVPVNMRIGVHSGYILSGLIGLSKWQYDIWSKDVTIANHMESSGKPGHVHITCETRRHLGDDFECFQTSEVDDPVIRESGYTTYLIKPPKKYDRSGRIVEEEEDEVGGGVQRDLQHFSPQRSHDTEMKDVETRSYVKSDRRVSIVTGPVPDRARRSNFIRGRRTGSVASRSGSMWSDEVDRKRRKSVLMDSSLHSFKSMLKGTEEFMNAEIEELPIGILDRWNFIHGRSRRNSKVEPEAVENGWKRRVSKDINPFFLVFRNNDWNWEYMKEHDPLFKHYILASFIILNFMGIILIVTSYNTRPHVVLWVLYVILFVFLVYLIPCTWISYIWDQIIDPQFDLDCISQPENPIIKYFYQASGKLNTKSMYRNLIFIFVSVMIVVSAVIDIVITPCKAESPRNYTYRCALAVMTIFMFLRINNLVKCLMTTICLVFFALIISGSLGNPAVKMFFSMETFGFDHWLMDPEDQDYSSSNWSHFLYIFGVAMFFIASDRQKEYVHRLDYIWKRQLKKDQEEASQTKIVNKILLQNILPNHVVDIYLNNEREPGKLYSESHDHVAVMFASLPKYIEFFSEAEINQGGEKPLKILNEIIGSFDKLKMNDPFNRVEKIKIIGATVMAACGLMPGRNQMSDARNQFSLSGGENARTLANYAAAMMRTLANFDYSKFNLENVPDFKLRVGIHSGSVIAGVVGAQKPLYDIWGDTVNVASRMDYTGVRGEIHIPESTAMALEALDPRVKCRYRDNIKVKGKGIMSTYYVELSEDMELVEEEWTQEELDNYARIKEAEDSLYENPDLTEDSSRFTIIREMSEEDSIKPDFYLSEDPDERIDVSEKGSETDDYGSIRNFREVPEEIYGTDGAALDGLEMTKKKKKTGILKLGWRQRGKTLLRSTSDESENSKSLRWQVERSKDYMMSTFKTNSTEVEMHNSKRVMDNQAKDDATEKATTENQGRDDKACSAERKVSMSEIIVKSHDVSEKSKDNTEASEKVTKALIPDEMLLTDTVNDNDDFSNTNTEEVSANLNIKEKIEAGDDVTENVKEVEKEKKESPRDGQVEEWTEEEMARLDEKKDSGYGSQGVIKVTEVDADPTYLKKSRPTLDKLPMERMAEHYEVFYDRPKEF